MSRSYTPLPPSAFMAYSETALLLTCDRDTLNTAKASVRQSNLNTAAEGKKDLEMYRNKAISEKLSPQFIEMNSVKTAEKKELSHYSPCRR